MKKFILLMFAYLMTVGYLSAQRTVTGTIADLDGLPLIGANVLVKGTTDGTITDLDGRFTLEVPDENQMLTVSYTGYETQDITVEGLNDVFVNMSEGQLLEEVVVVGYTTELKREVTSSITSVKAEEIEGLPVQSFDRAIQGKASGVQIGSGSGAPGGAATIRIRGVGSISAGSDPLIIVDGVQVGRAGQSSQGTSNPLSAINPNDIESIEILKDASSTAIYGAQGANGIIVVTTKGGNRNSKPKYQISYQEGVVQPMNLYEMMNSQQYADIRQAAYVNAGLSAEEAIELYGDPSDPNLPFYDWKDALWRDARLRTADFSFSGGNEKVDYYSGFSYNKQEGQIITNDWERYTGRFNLNANLSDKLSINLRTSLSWVNQEGTPCDGGFFVNCPFAPSFWSIPSSPAVDENGDYNVYPTNGEGHNFNFNQLQNGENVTRLGRTWQTISSLAANYEIIPGLTARAQFGMDFVNNKDLNSRPISIPFFRDAWGGQIFNRDRVAINYNLNTTLNYDFDLDDDNSFGFLVGYEFKREDWNLFDATGRGFADASFLNLNSAATPFRVAGTSTTNRRLGIFGSAKYSLQDKYIVNLTLRRDGSSRFGDENRWGIFYSGSVGWRISEEAFMQGSGVDELKLRVSYGVTGNSEIEDFDALAEFGTRGQYLGAPGLAPIRLANNLLGWEESAQTNIGLDFAFLNNRIYGTVDLWNKDSRNLLLDTQIPQTAGIQTSNITENVGKLNNKGVDLELNAVLVNSGGFNVTVGGTFSVQKNKVVELNGGRDTIFADGFPDLVVGQPIAFFNLTEFAGVNPANGRIMAYAADGSLTYSPGVEDVKVFDGALPDYFGGFRAEIGYKGLNLYSFFQYQGGNHVLNNDLFALASVSSNPDNQLISQADYWKQPGDITNVHKPVQGGIIEGIDQSDFGVGGDGSTRFYSDASYMRLKEVKLSYSLPNSLLGKTGLGNVTIYAQGLNLLTWTEFDGIDPEAVGTRQAFGGGGSSFAFPLGRQYSFGLNLTF